MAGRVASSRIGRLAEQLDDGSERLDLSRAGLIEQEGAVHADHRDGADAQPEGDEHPREAEE